MENNEKNDQKSLETLNEANLNAENIVKKVAEKDGKEVAIDLTKNENNTEEAIVVDSTENEGNKDEVVKAISVDENNKGQEPKETLTKEKAKNEEKVKKERKKKSKNVEEDKNSTNETEELAQAAVEVINAAASASYEIPGNLYQNSNPGSKKQYSVYSTLALLNNNSDLFHYTKNTVSSILKTIYSPEELKELIEKINAYSFYSFSKNVEKTIKSGKGSVTYSNVAQNVAKFMTQIHNSEDLEFTDKNTNSELVNSMFKEFKNGPSSLVRQVSSVHGDNRYYNKVDAEIGQLTPLFTKFKNEKEANAKIHQVEKYVSEQYGYKILSSNKSKATKKVIQVQPYKSSMDNCINMLYSVAKTFEGSKVKGINVARKLLNTNETHDYLKAKNIFGGYVGAKYEINDKKQKVSKIFKNHADEINDVVATLTTIFMARFVFDREYFPQIERDLTEQACNKMRNLRISKDPNDDYWINQLIQERLQMNVSQICMAHNITNANQLLEIYNANGTVIVNPEKIVSIDDLVFSVQYNSKEKVKNEELVNLPESKFEAKNTLKNNETKLKPYKFQENKPNAYLDKLRNTDAYKKAYKEEYARLKALLIDGSKEDVKEKLKEIKQNSQNNLNAINNLAENKNLSEEDQEELAKAGAVNDAVVEVCDDNLGEKEEVVDAEPSKPEEVEKPNVILLPEKTKTRLIEEARKEREDIENKKKDVDELTNVATLTKQEKAKLDEIKKQLDEREKTLNEKEKALEELFDDLAKSEQDLRDREAKLVNITTFKTDKNVKEFTNEEIKKKIVKHLNKQIHGSNGKEGLVGDALNYRVVEKKKSRKGSVNDAERVDDKELNKANKVRDEKIEVLVNNIADSIVEYYNKNEENIQNVRIPALVNAFFKEGLNIEEGKTFTVRDLKKYLAVAITREVNPELKEMNLEIYVPKKTYKKYQDQVLEV